MALTKVTGDFIKDGVLTQAHLHTSHGITTAHISEGSNLYFTNARVDSRIGSLSTSDLSEGTNLYYTNARARAAISATGSLSYNSTTGVMSFTMPAQNTSNITEGSNLYYTDARADARIAAADTGDLSEGSNLYYTNARARGAISVSGNALSYNSSTGVITSNFEESPTFSGNVVINGSTSSGNAFYVTRGSDGAVAFRITNTGEVVTQANYFYASASGVSMYVQNTAVFRGSILNDGSNAPVRIADDLTIDDDLTVTGGDITLGGTGRIQGIDTVSANTDAANKLYVDNQVAGIVASAPSTLDTLNELAAALGDDSNFSTTVTNSIATKLPLAGGALTGTLTCNNATSDKKIAFRRTGGNSFSIEHDSAFIYFYNETTSSVVFKMANNNNTTFTGDIVAPGIYVGSANTSYDFYNNGTSYFNGTSTFDDNILIPSASHDLHIGNNLSTTGKVRFGLSSWNNSLGLESYWMVLRTNQNEGLKLIDSAGNTYAQFNAGNNSSGANNTILTGYLYVNALYDQNDTSYYVNPGGTSNVYKIQSGSKQANPRWDTAFYVLQAQHWYGDTSSQEMFVGESGNNINVRGILDLNGGQGALNITNSSILSSASSSWTGNPGANGKIQYHSNRWYIVADSSSDRIVQFRRDGSDVSYIDNAGRLIGAPDARAPIFYDSNDTNHYLDPASTSVVNTLRFSGSSNNGRFDADEWGVRFKTDAGYILFGPANTGHAHIYTDRPNFYFNQQIQLNGGSLINTNDIRAKIFYDVDDTGYYVNPATGSNLYAPITFQTNDSTLTFQDAGTNAFQMKMGAGDELYLGSNNNYQLQMTTSGNVNTQGDWRFGANFVKVGNSSTYNSDDGSWGSRFVVSSTVHARIDCAQDANAVRASWFTHTGQLYSTFGTVTGHDMRLISHNATRQTLYNGYSEEEGSYRAPIFYDSNDTSFYLNPAVQSRLGSLKLDGIISGSASGCAEYGRNHAYHTNELKGYGAEFMIGAQSNHIHINYRTCNNGASGHTPTDWYWRAGSATSFANMHMGMMSATTNARAPEFIDSNNTAYYGDFANTSTSLSTAGKLVVQGSHGQARMHINYQHSASDSANSGALTSWVSEPGITYNGAGIGGNINVSGQYYGRQYNSGYGCYVRFDKSNGNVEHWVTTGNSGTAGGQGTRQWYNDNAGNSFSQLSSRAPVFYDSNNTSYYMDLHSTSSINAITLAGTFIGQNAYFAQSVGIGFTSGNIGGRLNVKNSAAGQIAGKFQLGGSVNSSSTGVFVNTTASYASSGMFLHFQSNHISGDDNVLIAYLDGDIVNKNNSYTQYSDQRLKENIVDATSKLDEIKQIRVRNFNFIGEDLKQIGVVAQELEPIFPGLVKEREVPGHEDPIKTVKYSVLVPILIKSMQEQQTIIDDLKSRLETLENN